VLVGTAGDLTVNAGTNAAVGVQAAGNLLLQAAAGNITLNANVLNTAGHTSLNASGNIVQNANITASGTAATIELIAGQAITMGASTVIGTNNGNMVLNAASGSVTLETLNAGTGNVAITAGGSITDGYTTAVEDITAAGLILKAGNSVGSSSNPLETAITKLAAITAADGIYLSELDAVSVNTVSVGVQRVNGQAGLSEQTVDLSDLTTTGGNGNIELISQSGSITLEDGTPADGKAVSANGSGSVLIKALGSGSDLTVNAKVLSASGPVTLFATETLTLSSVIVTTGVVKVDTSATGRVLFNKPVSSDVNQDIKVVANTVDIATPLASDGSLVISALAVDTGAPVNIVVGGATPVSGLHLDLTEIGLIQAGFTDITLGSGLATQTIVVNGKGTNGTVAFKDPLIIDASGVDNQVEVSGGLKGETLLIKSSASTTTTLNAANISMEGDVTLNGLLKVASGATIISAGNNANDLVTGTLTVTGNIEGTTNARDETLSLVSESGVLVRGTVKDIDQLTVNAIGDVTFNQTVSVSGNLDITTSGVVTFDKSLALSNGGTLTIHGASNVVFASGATVAVDGDLTIDAMSLSLLGGFNSLTSTMPNSTLTIMSAANNNNVMIGGYDASMLSLTVRDIQAIGNNFTKVVIGEAGLGNIFIAGNTDLSSLVTTSGNTTAGAVIEVTGASITLASLPGGVVQVPGSLTLSAAGLIELNSSISTVSSNTITVTSASGNITMASGTRIDSGGGDVQISAVNANTVTIGTINARSGNLSQQGIVDIQAGMGVITDANKDTAADIFAKAINLSGYGPGPGSNGDVLEAVAELVRIDVPSGSVLRHSDVDGRTYFDVVRAGLLYQQIVVVGNVTRVTEDPSTLLQRGDEALIAAGVSFGSSLLSASVLAQPTAALFDSAPKPFAMTAVSRYLAPVATSAFLEGDVVLEGIDLAGQVGEDLLSDSSYGLASRLQQSYILGTPGEQPMITGLDTFSQDNFEYWVDTLSL
jgi:hypothetical protein